MTTSQHGTRSRYTAGCRCDHCRDANTTYMRQWLQVGGNTVSTDRVRRRIRHLRTNRGQTLQTIAAGSGVALRTVQRLAAGKSDSVQLETAKAILEWQPPGPAEYADAATVMAMVDWMLDAGATSKARIASDAGVSVRSLRKRRPGTSVNRRLYDAMRRSYLNARKRATRARTKCPHCDLMLVAHTLDEPCERKEST